MAKNSVQAPTRKAQIREEAARLFKTNGYQATTMRLLAQAMQIEAASLYNHIESKQALLVDICFSVAQDFTEQLQQVQQQALSPQEQLAAILQFHLHMQLTRYQDVYVSNRDWKHLPPADLSKFLKQRKQYQNHLADIVKSGIALGQFRPIHPQIAVLGLLAGIRSVEHWQRHKQGISSLQLRTDLLALLLNGVAISHKK